jgi:tellurite resistance protein TerC
MVVSPWVWAGFVGFVLAMLALDLGVFHRKTHEITMREAAIWTGVWVGFAILFAGWIYLQYGATFAIQFITGYGLEETLSVDNLFVIIAIFSYLKIPRRYQHRVLFWGIIGALVMRGSFVGLGVLLIERFHSVLLIFGALLVITGVRIAIRSDDAFDPADNRLIKMVRKFMPVTHELHGNRFFIREAGRRHATPLFLALIVIELTDVAFAVDSIPAIFGVTDHGFIVFTATMMALLGLRSLYFLIAGTLDKFRYLHFGIAVILIFVGIKMILGDVWHPPNYISLLMIVLGLGGSVLASIVIPESAEDEAARLERKVERIDVGREKHAENEPAGDADEEEVQDKVERKTRNGSK